MKFFQTAPDGGQHSLTTGFFLIEIKSLFSVVLLHFRNGIPEDFHTHAFNALSLWVKGRVREHLVNGTTYNWNAGDLKYTSRQDFHRVEALGDAYCFSIRGPWADSWLVKRGNRLLTLVHGRRVVREETL